MESLTSNIYVFIVTIVLAFLTGRLLRTYLKKRRTRMLISDLENYFGQKLPGYKKKQNQGDVNWQKVLRMLKEEPTTQQVANLRQRVKDQLNKKK